MKKWVALLTYLVLILAVAGCGDHSAAGKPGSNQIAGVNDVLAQGMAEADSKKADVTDQTTENAAQSQQITQKQEAPTPEPSSEPVTLSIPEGSEEEIDVDLTALSSTMVYSEVYNMMAAPETYIGKTVLMKGPFAVYYDEAADNYYFACVIQDATACCAQGLEFVLAGEPAFPDSYPEPGTEICVTGVFDTYQEGDYTYCTLRNAKLL